MKRILLLCILGTISSAYAMRCQVQSVRSIQNELVSDAQVVFTNGVVLALRDTILRRVLLVVAAHMAAGFTVKTVDVATYSGSRYCTVAQARTVLDTQYYSLSSVEQLRDAAAYQAKVAFLERLAGTPCAFVNARTAQLYV